MQHSDILKVNKRVSHNEAKFVLYTKGGMFITLHLF